MVVNSEGLWSNNAMEHYSLLEVIITELFLFAIFAVLVDAYLEKNRDGLFLLVGITLVMGPIIYFYVLNVLVEVYSKKETPSKKENILIVIALLLLILLFLIAIDIGDLWYKVYIAILLVSVLQVYLTVKFRDKLPSRS